MTPSKRLVAAVMDVSRQAPFGLSSQELLELAERASGRLITTEEGENAVRFCLTQGWLSSRRDEFGQSRYWITLSGQANGPSL